MVYASNATTFGFSSVDSLASAICPEPSLALQEIESAKGDPHLDLYL